MSAHVRSIVLLLLAALAISCTTDLPPTPPVAGTPADRAAIADRTLDVTEVSPNAADLFPRGSFIQISFFGHGTFDLNASECHYASGRYAVENGRLHVAGVDAKVIGCGEVRDGRDWWFNRLLASEPDVLVEGDRVALAGADVSVTLIDHFEVATWELDPAFPLGPESRTLHLLVLEGACASGQSPEGRILDPIIGYEPDQITVEIRIRTMVNANCVGNAPYSYTVQLDEPVGDRWLSVGGRRIRAPEAVPTPDM